MIEYTHGFRIDEAALRRLPRLHARLPHRRHPRQGRQGARAARALHRLRLVPDGLPAGGVITATTSTLEEFDHFAFKVAVPSPVLYGQFPLDVRPEHIAQGLLAVGFDAVWDYGVDIALVARAIVDYVDEWHGPLPLISITCPVVVRLIQVAYPRMLEQLDPHPAAARDRRPRGQAALLARSSAWRPDEIAAIYVTPCQARTISILQPAEGGRSYLDGAVGIPQLYNDVLAAAREVATRLGADRRRAARCARPSCSAGPRAGRSPSCSSTHRYLSVTGLPNVIRVFDDIEKGKLSDIDFLRVQRLLGRLLQRQPHGGQRLRLAGQAAEPDAATCRTPTPSPRPRSRAATQSRTSPRSAPSQPREHRGGRRPARARTAGQGGSSASRRRCPGLDCGLCGAPTCAALARDVAMGDAKHSDCVLLSNRRLEDLRRLHRHGS